MLNLEWFRTFKAIYETGNQSTAAQALFISQAGVSLHLNSLESYTGYRLFERETRKMIPTERGTILYNCIIDPVNRLVEAEQMFSGNSRRDKRTISVGLDFETFEHTLAAHVAHLPFNLIVRFGENAQMLHDLGTGALDLVLTAQKAVQPGLEYTAFKKERIILVCGSQTDTTELDLLLRANNPPEIREWLKHQTWYTTTADMGHLKTFWLANFDCLPDFKPNYVLPFMSAILRCMHNGKGFAVMPDFLCRTGLENGSIRVAWEGDPIVENMLYFGRRKKARNIGEVRQLEEILTKNWFL